MNSIVLSLLSEKSPRAADAVDADMQVDPVLFDITEDLAAGGAQNEIAYKGLFRGSDPDPQRSPGYIMMQSSLIFYLE